MRGFSNFKEIPPEDWIEARIIFHAEPDTLAPAYSQHGLYPELYWTRVKFLTSMITDHWPSASDNARVSSVVTPVPTGERERTSVVEGKSVPVRVDLGGRRIIKNKTKRKQ